jgi:hypothetical protein
MTAATYSYCTNKMSASSVYSSYGELFSAQYACAHIKIKDEEDVDSFFSPNYCREPSRVLFS